MKEEIDWQERYYALEEAFNVKVKHSHDWATKAIQAAQQRIQLQQDLDYWKKRCEAAEALLKKYYKRIPDCPELIEWHTIVDALNSEPAVQVSDTTKLNQGTDADNKKKTHEEFTQEDAEDLEWHEIHDDINEDRRDGTLL